MSRKKSLYAMLVLIPAMSLLGAAGTRDSTLQPEKTKHMIHGKDARDNPPPSILGRDHHTWLGSKNSMLFATHARDLLATIDAEHAQYYHDAYLKLKDEAGAIFVQAQVPVNAAQTVAAAVGAAVVSLDPISRDWKTNIRAMGEALSASVSPHGGSQ